MLYSCSTRVTSCDEFLQIGTMLPHAYEIYVGMCHVAPGQPYALAQLQQEQLYNGRADVHYAGSMPSSRQPPTRGMPRCIQRPAHYM